MRILLPAFLALFAASASAQDDPKKAAQEEAKKKEDEAKARIAEFKKEFKAAKTDKDRCDVIAGLSALGSPKHPKILDELKAFLKSPSTEIAIAAAEQVAKYEKDKDAADILVSMASARREKDVVVKFLRYAGDVGHRPTSAKLTGFFKNRETDIAREAVDSCAKLKSKDVIDPLLALWRELDNIKEQKADGLGELGGGLTGTNPIVDEQQNRKRDLTPAVESALSKITGADFKTLKEANEWWRKNRATFKEIE
jgi:hypothetical protein